MPTTIRVALGERSYDIAIGRGTLGEAGPLVRDRLAARHAVVMADSGVRQPHGEMVRKSLASAGIRSELVEVPAGEASKSVREAERLWNELVALKADRKSIVVAVGGGVMGDLAGFVAATFARGLPFVQVPTTLLAQVDSSVGGKVGVNLPAAKNIVGAFWQPAGVLIDLDTLATLPDREFRSGLAEVVKYGVILDADFFAWLESHAAELDRPRPGGPGARGRPQLPPQSRRCRARRTRADGAAGRPELWPYVLPCDRNGHRLWHLSARRSSRDWHGLCLAVGGAAGPNWRRRHSPASTAADQTRFANGHAEARSGPAFGGNVSGQKVRAWPIAVCPAQPIGSGGGRWRSG